MNVTENPYCSESISATEMDVSPARRRFPFCIVWTPIPILTWLFPFIGHMGIATSRGVIRDFAGSYCVNEDDMAFGWPTRYLKLDVSEVPGGAENWDRAVRSASDEYKGHVVSSDVTLFLHLGFANVRKTALRWLWRIFEAVVTVVYIYRIHRIDICRIFNLTESSFNLKGFEMVRLTVDLINDSLQYINTVRERELSLRACKIPVLENLGVTRDQYDTIDLTDNDIRKLENIPLLKRLSCLLMHNNRVQQIMPNIGEVLPSLRTLALTNNNLCELGDIDPLGTCKKLEYLTLVGNPVTHKSQYRFYVIYKVPSVRVLDFRRVRLAERKQAAALFKGKKGQKIREQLVKKSIPISDERTNNTESSETVRGKEETKKIRDAIASASSLTEVEHLQSILRSGQIPEKDWNVPHKNAETSEENANEKDKFVEETEDEKSNEEQRGEVNGAGDEDGKAETSENEDEEMMDHHEGSDDTIKFAVNSGSCEDVASTNSTEQNRCMETENTEKES
ncbi:unnamed protein product [Anisakis simplex]|uniref:Probable U2 small nuclear ribonucleoprotein A' n=1 Tax=Anisakis simplex TaxID=6269 RepID=A0A158PPA5_ANISI|nr:unnamed protein product [Anisakis simplex]